MEETNLNYYECLIQWEVENGKQIAYAYCNATGKRDALGKVLSRIPYRAYGETSDIKVYPYNEKMADNVKVWYFTGEMLLGTEKEHHEIY